MIEKKLLVTGYCRSGTTTLTQFFNDCGIHVLHEFMGSDGTVSCFFFTDCKHYPLKKRLKGFHYHQDEHFSDYQFKNVFHVVRNPLACIPSHANNYSAEHKLWLHSLGLVDINIQPDLLHAAHTWLAVNEAVEKIATYRFRIEDLESAWKDIYRILKPGVKRMPDIPRLNQSKGHRPANEIKRLLKSYDMDLFYRIKYKARKYGYQL